jgi:hypothetical protein
MHPLELARRRFLYQSLTGCGALALADLATREATAAVGPHHQPKAKACIFLSMLGGVAQQDTFDPKPLLNKLHGTQMDWSKERATDQANLFANPRLFVGTPFKFKKYGQCGRDVSELFPNVAECVDDMAFVRSIQTENGNHPAAVFLMNTGFVMPGKPSLGSGSQQWGSGFLPAAYQGTMLRWKGDPIQDLAPPPETSAEAQQQQMSLLRAFNKEHLARHSTNPDLAGRIDSYELAYRMQAEVPGTLDIAKEDPATLDMYGFNDANTESFGKRCLMARKLVEKGVRFVQIYTPSQSWDSHTELDRRHRQNSLETDKPIAALLKDLKRRGLLDSTLVVWMGEFGRTPDCPSDVFKEKAGRDHNTRAMTIWFAGGGVKRGTIVGETDDMGFKAVRNIYRMRDVHATVLHLMGLSDMRLTFYHAGRNMRLTDTGGRVISEVLA